MSGTTLFLVVLGAACLVVMVRMGWSAVKAGREQAPATVEDSVHTTMKLAPRSAQEDDTALRDAHSAGPSGHHGHGCC